MAGHQGERITGGLDRLRVVFSSARAVQSPALEIWGGQPLNSARARQALYHGASCNHAALCGDCRTKLEAA